MLLKVQVKTSPVKEVAGEARACPPHQHPQQDEQQQQLQSPPPTGEIQPSGSALPVKKRKAMEFSLSSSSSSSSGCGGTGTNTEWATSNTEEEEVETGFPFDEIPTRKILLWDPSPPKMNSDAPTVAVKNTVEPTPPESSGEERQQLHGEEEEPPKKKRTKAHKYTDEEIARLLYAVGRVQPANDLDWHTVKQVYEDSAPPDCGSPIRSVQALRGKMSNLSLKLVMKAVANKPPGESLLHVNPLTGQASIKESGSSNDAPLLGRPNGTRVDNEQGTPKPFVLSEDATRVASDEASTEQQAERLSSIMIRFFEQFNAASGMVVGKETLDGLFSRLQQIESDVKHIKGLFQCDSD